MRCYLTSALISLLLLLNHISNAQVDNGNDQKRISELNEVYKVLRKTIQEGDFQGYSNLYHDDAVVVFTAGETPKSISIKKALAGWKIDFENTKSGKTAADVEFRFYQRVGDETTAHESGIFNYRSYNPSGEVIRNYFGHLEILLVKLNGKWKMTMEYQKKDATKKEWDKLAI